MSTEMRYRSNPFFHSAMRETDPLDKMRFYQKALVVHDLSSFASILSIIQNIDATLFYDIMGRTATLEDMCGLAEDIQASVIVHKT